MLQRWVETGHRSAGLIALALAGCAAIAGPEQISVNALGEPANGSSSIILAVTPDGRYVAFTSFATNLHPGDQDMREDVFVRDRVTGTTEPIVDRDNPPEQAARYSALSISADGRFVAFSTDAPDLVSRDENDAFDVFVHDRQSGRTERVSLALDGGDANGESHGAALSADGRFVAFTSLATNLVAGDTNEGPDTFVHDRLNGTTRRVSLRSGGAQATLPGGSVDYGVDISADGRVIAFTSTATDLVPDDTNGVADVFVHDLESGQTQRVSVSSAGGQADRDCLAPRISADGRFVAFASPANTLVPADTNSAPDVFVHDRERAETARVSVGPGGAESDGWSTVGGISRNGQVIVFTSTATNLVDGDANGTRDVFVRDQLRGTTERASVGRDGEEGDAYSPEAALAADGGTVVFVSAATNFSQSDLAGILRVFTRELRGADSVASSEATSTSAVGARVP